jgi:hypothetical protein
LSSRAPAFDNFSVIDVALPAPIENRRTAASERGLLEPLAADRSPMVPVHGTAAAAGHVSRTLVVERRDFANVDIASCRGERTWGAARFEASNPGSSTQVGGATGPRTVARSWKDVVTPRNVAAMRADAPAARAGTGQVAVHAPAGDE